MRTLETIFAWFVKIVLFAVPFLPLLVTPALLFPFITGKNLTFRIAMEVIFVIWVWLAIAKPEYRPRLTWLFRAVTIFTAIVFFADLFSPNLYRAFFSNYERMEGFMMIGHLYLYFVMLSSMFRRRDWMIFFHTTLASSVLVSWVGLMQKFGWRVSLQGGFRVDSTIGNPTYLAAYLLFHIWLLLLLLYTWRKKVWIMPLYSAVLLFELAILYFTATRGAILALGAAGIAFALACVVWWPRIFSSEESVRRARSPSGRAWGRRAAAGILALAIVVPLGFWLARSTSYVQSNQVLRRLTNYSLQEGTIKARFKIWNMSWHGFLERPILGWGQENYYLVFQKYYNPALWGDEPWFDRSHNIFFDWLIHAGVLGLGAYLFMYGVVFRGLAGRMKKGTVPFWNGLIVMAMLAGHLFQNLFVFDNLNTYLLLFGFFAYAGYLMEEKEPVVPAHAVATDQKKKIGRMPQTSYARASALALMFGVILLPAGYYLHIAPIEQSRALIKALLTYQYQGTVEQTLDAFQKAVAYNSFGTTEVREQIANTALSVLGSNRYGKDDQKKFAAFAIQELEKETATSAKDVKHLIFLGSVLNRSIELDPSYAPEAGRVLEEATKLSPGKQMAAFELAQYYALRGDGEHAVGELYRAWRLAPDYRTAAMHLWVFSILTGKKNYVDEVRASFNLDNVPEADLNRLGEAYRRVQDYDSALGIYAALVHAVPDNGKYRAGYAALLAHAGRRQEAIDQVKEAVRLDPSLEKEADVFIKQLNK